MSAKKITIENFNEEVLNSEKRVLLDFWATWCGPCRMVGPVIDEIADENPEYMIGKVNVDEQPELAQKFGIMSIPSLIVMENGSIVSSSVGAKPKDKILAMLKG